MSETLDTTPQTHGIELSEVAANKVKSLLEQEGRDDLRLRIAVQPGGCSGLMYQLYFDERLFDDDQVRDFDGVEVLVDAKSAPNVRASGLTTHRPLVPVRVVSPSTDNRSRIPHQEGGEYVCLRRKINAETRHLGRTLVNLHSCRVRIG